VSMQELPCALLIRMQPGVGDRTKNTAPPGPASPLPTVHLLPEQMWTEHCVPEASVERRLQDQWYSAESQIVSCGVRQSGVVLKLDLVEETPTWGEWEETPRRARRWVLAM
jgi:hypothetical protein